MLFSEVIKNGVAIHTPLEEQADQLMVHFDGCGYRWRNGDKATDDSRYNNYNGLTCYKIESEGIGYFEYERDVKYRMGIVEYDDIEFDDVDIQLKSNYKCAFNDYDFIENMNLSYLDGRYDKCSLRNNEIERICEILLKKRKCNPILVGKAGCGKTSIVECLTEKIVELKRMELNGGSRHPLADKVILSIDLNSMMSGCKYRGDFEEKLKKLLDFAKSNSNIILFIDEIHNIVSFNNSKETGTTSMGQVIKQPLARGEICVIGATTDSEYNIISEDRALARRFMPVMVKEFSKSQMESIIGTISETYTNFHKVKITNKVLVDALNYCDKFYESGVYPDKFVDLLDETFARVRLNKWKDKEVNITIEDICQTITSQTGKVIVTV